MVDSILPTMVVFCLFQGVCSGNRLRSLMTIAVVAAESIGLVRIAAVVGYMIAADRMIAAGRIVEVVVRMIVAECRTCLVLHRLGSMHLRRLYRLQMYCRELSHPLPLVICAHTLRRH